MNPSSSIPGKLFLVMLLSGLLVGTASARNPDRSVLLLRSTSALTPPDGLVLFGVSTTLQETDWSTDELSAIVTEQTTTLNLEWGPLAGFRVWGRLPWRSRSGAGILELEDSASGPADATIGLVAAPWRPTSWLGLGLDLRTTLPTGDQALGFSEGEMSPYYGMTATWQVWPDGPAPEMRVHLRLGRQIHPADAGRGGAAGGVLESWPLLYPAIAPDGSSGDNDPWIIGTALEFRRGNAGLAVEWTRQLYPDGLMSPQEEPSFLTAMLRWGGETGPALTLAYDVAMSLDDVDTPYTPYLPDMMVRIGLSWSLPVGGRDSDGDGLKDRLDPCPKAAEDFDGFRDDDGCPDPDNDEDGVPDAIDLAPDLPEDFDGWEDEDGRPDPDNDRDGILDINDDCPDEAEDFDGHQDDDGCPEEFEDRDGDGIPDEDDVCPDEPEDIDGFRDTDGCPDLDNDLDGIPDALDACPNEAEDYNGVDDEDGCPEKKQPSKKD